MFTGSKGFVASIEALVLQYWQKLRRERKCCAPRFSLYGLPSSAFLCIPSPVAPHTLSLSLPRFSFCLTCTLALAHRWKFAAKDFFSAYTHHAWLAGAAAGATETLVNNPFETIKVRMQAKENIGKINSLGEAATMILRQDGVTGLYRGFQAQFSRNAVWNAAYFGIIGAVPPSEAESKSARLAHKFAVGSLGSMVGTLLNVRVFTPRHAPSPIPVPKHRTLTHLGLSSASPSS